MKAPVRSFEALAVRGPERVEFARVELPEPGPDQVLIEVSACGICGSDLRLYREGEMEAAFFGHEFSGRVVSVGSGVEDFKTGDRVAAGLARACGICEPCQRGFPNYCVSSANQFYPGGFAQYCLANCAQGFKPIIRIPDAIDDVRATLFEPLSCAMRIATRVTVARGSRVLVLGLGMMGMLAALLLKKSTPGVCIVGADTSAACAVRSWRCGPKRERSRKTVQAFGSARSFLNRDRAESSSSFLVADRVSSVMRCTARRLRSTCTARSPIPATTPAESKSTKKAN